MSISIVIPALNEEKFLPLILSDLASQTVQPDEIIIADANSTDNTVQVANEYKAIVTAGGNPAASRNRGAEIAKSEYILFLDADVRLQDQKFLAKAQHNFQQQNLDIANFKFGKVDYWFASLVYLSWNYLQKFSQLFPKPYVSGGGILVKQRIFQELGGFNESLETSEDLDFAHRAIARGYKFGVIPQFIYPSPRRYRKVGVFTVILFYAIGTIIVSLNGKRIYKKIQSAIQTKAGNWGKW